MPMRMGGSGHRRVEDLEATSRANGGSLLSAGPDSEVGLYHRVVALVIDQGFAAARHRALQADPMRLSDEQRPVTISDGLTVTMSPLERWERILRLRPAPTATVTQRRFAVAQRMRLSGLSALSTLKDTLDKIFAPWPVIITIRKAADLTLFDAYWPLAAGTAAYPGSVPSGTLRWYSGCYSFFFDVAADVGTSVEELARRMQIANATIDDMLPAHAYFYGGYL